MPALPNIVSEALARYKLPGNRIELEVTEGVFLGDNGSTLDVLKRLRALGVGIALDDFGTGYSSIGYLNKAVFHKLKIDGSFVREAGSRPENVAIIQSIVQLAKSFRMSITAEGVETAEDFERMRDLGCDIIQGYLFGKPLAYERANQMVLGPRRQAHGGLSSCARRAASASARLGLSSALGASLGGESALNFPAPPKPVQISARTRHRARPRNACTALPGRRSGSIPASRRGRAAQTYALLLSLCPVRRRHRGAHLAQLVARRAARLAAARRSTWRSSPPSSFRPMAIPARSSCSSSCRCFPP